MCNCDTMVEASIHSTFAPPNLREQEKKKVINDSNIWWHFGDRKKIVEASVTAINSLEFTLVFYIISLILHSFLGP